VRGAASTLLVLLLAALAASADGERDADADLRRRLKAMIGVAEYEEALRLADATLVGRPDSIAAWQYRAYALQQLGRHPEARAAYAETLRRDPRNWWAHMNLASLLAAGEQWEEAEASARRAVHLAPKAVAARRKLSRILRERGKHRPAATAVRRALLAEVDPTWCHAELGYLTWVLGERDAAAAHWKRARELGHDPVACAHGLWLVEGDRETTPPGEAGEAVDRRRRGEGEPWTCVAGRVEVHTRVGPVLPRAVETWLVDLQRETEAFLGMKGAWASPVRIHLARTREEHERRRRAMYPTGARGKAWHLDRRGDGPPRAGRREGALDMYVCWSEPGFERSTSHELIHALLRLRVPHAPDVPAWLDEGLATYLELVPDGRGRLRSGTVRGDLLASIREAKARGGFRSWGEMLVLPRTAFYGADAHALYAEAWSMVHFLAADGERGRRKLRRLLDELGSTGRLGAGPLRRTFGDARALERAWRRHLEKLTVKLD
jgi:Flp pilus assembly protein TadD